MSKLNILVKNIEVFEKLSLYGTSSSFLKKISQDASFSLTALDRVKGGAVALLNYLSQLASKATPPAIASTIDSANAQLKPLIPNDRLSLEQTHAVMAAAKNIEKQFAALPNGTTYTQVITPIVMQMELNYKAANYAASQTRLGPGEKSLKPVSVNDLPQAQSTKTPIPIRVQKALNYLGSPIKLIPDGTLGRETQKALDWFKDKYQVYTSSGEPLYNFILSEFEKKHLNPDLPDLSDAYKN